MKLACFPALQAMPPKRVAAVPKALAIRRMARVAAVANAKAQAGKIRMALTAGAGVRVESQKPIGNQAKRCCIL